MDSTRLQEERLKPLLLASAPPTSNGHHTESSTSSTPATAHTRPSIPALTGLRAALMLHVLIRNMRLVDGVDMFGWMVDAGAVGVSTFFCLSGFILAYCYGDHRFSTWRCYFSFIGRRYARLLPVYYLSQLISIGEQVNAVKRYGWDGWSVLHWLAQATGTHMWWPWPVYAPSANPSDRGYFMLNPMLWALSVVLFFYVSMPPLMRAVRWFIGVDRLSELPRGKSTSRLLWLFVLFSVLIWTPIVASLHSDYAWVALHMPYTRVPEFALGVVCAALYLSIRQRQQQVQEQTHDVENALSASQGDNKLIDYLASTPLLNSHIVLDVVTALTVVLVVLLALPSVDKPLFIDVGQWLAIALCYLILLLALASSSNKDGGKHGVVSWLLTRPVALELGAMSFCFYAFHFVPIIYAISIGLPPNRSAAIEYCTAVGLAWIGYKYVETPVYNMLSARLPSCHCHKA